MKKWKNKLFRIIKKKPSLLGIKMLKKYTLFAFNYDKKAYQIFLSSMNKIFWILLIILDFIKILTNLVTYFI